MKLEGKITMLINHDHTSIKIEDANSNTVLCEVTLTPEQLSSALSRLSYTPCELSVRPEDFDKIGKVHENQTFAFELPDGMDMYTKDTKILQEHAQTLLTDGWVAENYFKTQTSFFTKDGKNHARCTIRRWV